MNRLAVTTTIMIIITIYRNILHRFFNKFNKFLLVAGNKYGFYYGVMLNISFYYPQAMFPRHTRCLRRFICPSKMDTDNLARNAEGCPKILYFLSDVRP